MPQLKRRKAIENTRRAMAERQGTASKPAKKGPAK
jgi:hypothetical protein